MAIISPWAYLPFHIGHSFPLSKWMGSGSIGMILIHVFNMTCYFAEHWTNEFPGVSKFVYDVRLHEYSIFMMLSFFYFSYYNCGDNQSLVRNWFFATIVFMGVTTALDAGYPKPTAAEQMWAEENDVAYVVGHFIGHCWLFVMAWHVSSTVDISNGLKKGWIGDYIKKTVKSWDGAEVNPFYTLGVSLLICVGTIIFAVSVELMRAANGGTVPFFPPMCRAVVSEQDDCTFMGITIPCFKVFNKDTVAHFGMGLEMAAIWTFVITFLIGLVPLCKIVDEMWYSGNNNWNSSALKIACALYSVETAIFALIRYYWGVCKPLVAAAAVHNLCEWGIVLSISMNYKELEKYLPMAAFFITFLVTLCICVPNLFLSLGLEQSFGIMLDFGMPIMFTLQLLDNEKRKIYLLPAIAHTVHIFGTILPLVYSIMLSNHVSWFSTFFLEILINVTVPAAHFIYCYWSFDLERILTELRDAPPAPPAPARRFTTFRFSIFQPLDHDEVPSVIGSDESSVSEPTDASGGGMHGFAREPPQARWKSEPSVASEEDDSEDEGILPPKYRIDNTQRFLGMGFVLGLFTLAYIPLAYMPECDAPPCLTQRYVSKTSILTLSDDMLESGGTIKETVQRLPGLVELHVGRALHDVAADKYIMVKTWSAKENMTDDTLSHFIDASAGDDLIDEAMSRQLDVATVNKKQCASERIDSIKVQPQYSCKKLWRVLSSPGYCAWIPGCKFAATQSSHHAQLYMGDGTTLPAVITKNKKEKKISVSVLSQTELPGYSAVMTLEKTGNGLFPWSNGNKSCNLKYEFRINAAYLSSPSKRSDNFNEYFLPDLYTKLSQK
eukprot:CAMPEP_0113413536 /NCGR_PEP_ID=MMETSP0013_2-20120614/23490_1 /TAXON_ID=2843 ORGANISM="Skeletonema costatum, Strain 1716" /NCGR_SAMPLE_ID=MMETSP0013_2 /ASSEMBLY_ACC=CAM_ASM_000158 /LENGTH=834 /DNA_ID=CAMNT_0000300241 /DNA_START=16 /DNA_END=2520 /DNA_ORIENTATION=- /assembly_acc=CAM_ASM_000158